MIGSETDKREKLLEEKRHVTGKVSDLCRFIGFGLLAIFYALLVGDTWFAKYIRGDRIILLYAIGFSGALAILFDYLQFMCGERAVREALERPSQDYNTDSLFHWGRRAAFAAKQLATGVGAGLLVLVVVAAMLSPPAPA